MLTLNDGRNELWQWDTGRKLSVDADCSQVHFSNKVFGRSIDVDVIDGIAIVPDILLQTDKDLNVWAFVGTAENGYTKISKTFKVNRRNKPADYVFTPPDQTSLEEIKERIDALEEKQDPDAIKNAVEDYMEQNPVEFPVKSVNGKTGQVKLTAEDVGAISQDDLQNATNEALAKAKEGGEFDGAAGPQGPQGEKGEQGIQGIPGPTGATGPQGEPGKDGVNGVTPHVGSNGNWFIGETDTGIPATGPAGGQGLPGAPGDDGKDGTSATHSWNGTVLTITSASGTSSANLKGEKGDKGDTGAAGKDGAQGPAGPQGETGPAGANATINGVNALTVKGGQGVSATQSGSTLTISANYTYGTTDLTAGTSALTTGKMHLVYE